MFILLKLIKPFLLPPTLIAIGMLTSLFLFLLKKQRLGKTILLLTLLSYYLLSIEPVAFFLARSLASKNVILNLQKEVDNIEAIVILAGGANKKEGYRLFNELSGASWKRFWHGIKLYKKFNAHVPILYSGGSGNLFDQVSVEAELAKNYAMDMLIPENKFWIESKSRNTYESGVEIKRILDDRFPGEKEHRIILVTSYLHMPRSIGVMKKNGLYAIPSPADFAIGSLKLDLFSFIPSLGNFTVSNFAIHEWIGIGGYKLLGRT